MVAPTQRDSEFIAHLAPERSTLGKPEVVGIRGVDGRKRDKVAGQQT